MQPCLAGYEGAGNAVARSRRPQSLKHSLAYLVSQYTFSHEFADEFVHRSDAIFGLLVHVLRMLRSLVEISAWLGPLTHCLQNPYLQVVTDGAPQRNSTKLFKSPLGVYPVAQSE